MSLNLSPKRWLARLLAVMLGTALLATGTVRADEPEPKKSERPLEPVFDPVFSGEQPVNDPAKAKKSVAPKKTVVAGKKPAAGVKGKGARSARPVAPKVAVPVAIDDPGDYPVPDKKTVDKVRAVNQRIRKDLMAKDGVFGTATALLEDGSVVLRVYVDGFRKPVLPKQVDGVQIVSHPGPPIVTEQALGKPTRQQRLPRPVPIGTSSIVSDPDVCASGTYGTRLKGRTRFYGLSNNHVFANENEAPIGTNIVQPSQGEDPENNCEVEFAENVIGSLSDFYELLFDGTPNLMDAAVIDASANFIGSTTLPDGYGHPTSTVNPAFLGLRVQKYGRTTGQTFGIVTEVDVTFVIGYSGGDALMADNITITGFPEETPFSQGGDSGSLVVDMNRNPVGLHFAGQQVSATKKISFSNRIENVLAYFRRSLGEPTLRIDGSSPVVPPGKLGTGNPNRVTGPLVPSTP